MPIVIWDSGEKFGEHRRVHFDYALVDSDYVQERHLCYNHSL